MSQLKISTEINAAGIRVANKVSTERIERRGPIGTAQLRALLEVANERHRTVIGTCSHMGC